MTLSEKSAEAGHRAVSLHRDCVLVCISFNKKGLDNQLKIAIFSQCLLSGKRKILSGEKKVGVFYIT